MRAQPFVGAAIGGAIAAATASVLPERSLAWPRLSFLPDLLTIASPPVIEIAAPAIAGAAVAFLAGGRRGNAPLVRSALAFGNPLTIYALSLGAGAALALCAGALLAAALARLAFERDHGAIVGLAIAAAIGPLISSSLLGVVPFALILAVTLSPWGWALRNVIGVLVVVSAPLVMALLGILYLSWLLGPLPGAAIGGAEAPARDILLVACGAILAGVSGRVRSLPGGIAVFVLGAVILAAARPDLAASLTARFL